MTDQINGEQLVPADPRNSLSTPRPPQQTLLDLGPKEMVARAREVADVLKDIIVKQRLYVDIQGKQYVKVEAWTTMGSMIGFLPREREVVEEEDGSFTAYVDLYDVNGVKRGEGSALCGMDEARWKRADRYARRSMAITRATGKAYRSAFSWVMTLAGYEPTPEEEMPDRLKRQDDDEIPFGPEAEAKAAAKAKPVKPPTHPADMIYENTLPEQTELAKQLDAWSVPDDLHEQVGARLKGRRRGDARKVVDELMKEYQP